MSAAVEASIEGIPAVGFSLLDYSMDADFSGAAKYAAIIATQMLKYGLPQGTLLNVNIPALPAAELKGIRICRQAIAKWEEEYDERYDPHGKKYFWLTGKFVNYDNGNDSDEWALANGYVSVVPVQYDMTAHHAIAFFNKNWEIAESTETDRPVLQDSSDTIHDLG
jgi:5'-nucleotidase